MIRRVAAALATLLPAAPPAGGSRTVLDAFRDVSAWTAAPSEGVRLALSLDARDGPALRLDFDFQGHAGWAAARRPLDRALPENWALELRVRGEAPPETLEVKLIDRTGRNVWWSVRRDFSFPRTWTTLRLRKRQFSFAWGPNREAELREAAAIEVTITAGTGGRGSVWLAELALEELPKPPETPPRPTARASSALPGEDAGRAVDGDPSTAWRSDPASPDPQEIVFDLGGRRELGGVVLDWDARDFPRRGTIELSGDGETWSPPRRIERSRGGRVWVYLPDAEASLLRLRLEASAGRGYALRELAVEPPSFSDTPTAFLRSVARDSPRGEWPRSFRDEQLYWALVGVDGGRAKGLLSEDGAVETGRGAFSVEPFLHVGGRLLAWSDAKISQRLEDGDLPIPSVRRRHGDGLDLEVLAFADGPPDSSTMRVRYRVINRGRSARRVGLDLAFRPMQVNPPWQFLSTPGGFAPVRSIAREGETVSVNGETRVAVSPAPSGFGAASFDAGEIGSWLSRGELPSSASASDPDGFASGAAEWSLDVPPGTSRDVFLAVPLSKSSLTPTDPADFDQRLAETSKQWREKLDRVAISLPAPGDLARAVRANLAWILAQRDGPALQPGSRSYARAWIRDGALIGEALLRLGHAAEVREFLRWYAPYQFESGAVPCCVDSRGADPVPENDSHGELIFLAGAYLRFTGDRATLEELWPRLAKAAAYIDALRGKRRTEEFRSGEKLRFFGLLPESISHEGYSDRPVHSYWDDLWAVRGLADAAEIATALGHVDDASRLAASRDEMRKDLESSIRRVVAERRIDYVPGSADLADFDATSTTIAFDPCGEAGRLPDRELEHTFERYWEEFQARLRRPKEYTPYEWRSAGVFVRLGFRDRAAALFDAFLADRRPVAWNQWPEVVYPDARAPKFLGDLPHAWVSADFLRAFLDAIAWEREEDGAIVLLSGVRPDWLRGGGLSISGLRTAWGSLDISALEEEGTLRIRVAGSAAPHAGFVLRPPLRAGERRARVNGETVPVPASGEIAVRSLPAEIEIR